MLFRSCLVPLRHVEWGANMNNTAVTSYAWGSAITQATMYHTMDRLGLAQYLSRIGLQLDANSGRALDAGKQTWLTHPAWQGVRRVMERLFVTHDWFELFVAQNLVFDGLLYPLVYRRYVDKRSPATGNALGMLTEFQVDWFDETSRWVDATLKTAADESPANATQLTQWYRHWRDEIVAALEPLAPLALGGAGAEALAGLRAELDTRVARVGIAA